LNEWILYNQSIGANIQVFCGCFWLNGSIFLVAQKLVEKYPLSIIPFQEKLQAGSE